MSDTRYQVESGFYDAVNHDRVYSADQMNEPYKMVLTEGIIEGGFAVTQNSPAGMSVLVAPGNALLGGKWVASKTQKMLTVPDNPAMYGRYDAVILQVDTNTDVREAAIVYRTGTPAAEPEVPSLINSGGISEVMLAYITVAAGATSISTSYIHDTRGGETCPYMMMQVGDAQIQAAVEDVLEAHPEWTTTVEDGSITLAKLAAGVIDNTLTQAGAAADAKKTGDEISGLKDALNDTNNNIYNILYNGYLLSGSPSYKRGGINLLTGEFYTDASVADKQMVNSSFSQIKLESDSISISLASGYEIRGCVYSPDGSYYGFFGSWTTGGTIAELQNKKGYHFIPVIRKTNGNSLTDEEVASAGESTLVVSADLGLDGGIIGELENIEEASKPFDGKKIVNFGDSIFGNFRDTNETTDKSISKMLQEALGGTFYNAGFGGCRMGYHSEGWRAFSMYSLADAITTGTWTEQDSAIANPPTGLPDYFSDTLTMLKSLDFSEIDYITIGYGVNDYTGNAFIDYKSGLQEYQYFKGALEYSLRTILETYPQIRILVITPCWMWFPNESTGLLDYSSDDNASANTRGLKLTDYVQACKTVCDDLHNPCVDTYTELGFNQYSYKAYFPVKGVDGYVVSDGTHPKQAGRQLRADRIAGQMIALFCH